MSIDKAVHDVVEEIAAAHPDRSFQIEARTGLRGEWDCQRFSQALTNVIVNAIDHGSKGGVVNVTVESNEHEISVAVHNNGTAIPSSELNGIFNAMKTSRENGNGSSGRQSNLGLGLYIAERILHAHNGCIDVESSDAKGTTFTMRLPRVSPARMT
jgi:Signal transduction histidine kinase